MECHAPRAGDVVIRREAGRPRDHYSIRAFPGRPQVSYMSFEVALDVATRFARSAGTNVLFEEDGQFGLVESRAVRPLPMYEVKIR